MLNFCVFIQVFVFTPNHHLKCWGPSILPNAVSAGWLAGWMDTTAHVKIASEPGNHQASTL